MASHAKVELIELQGACAALREERDRLRAEVVRVSCPRIMSTDLNGLICKIQRAAPSFADHPGDPSMLLEAPDACCERRN